MNDLQNFIINKDPLKLGSFLFLVLIYSLIFYNYRRNSMGIFFGLWRRIFGGYDCKFDIFDKRGIQMIICILTVFLWEWLVVHKVWYISAIVAVFVYIFWCKGHFYYFALFDVVLKGTFYIFVQLWYSSKKQTGILSP